MARLDATAGNGAAPAGLASLTWKAGLPIRSARAPCISARRSTGIHGTNEPETIGTNVSSGCIRLTNDDVTDLYSRVRVGTRVIVM